MFRIVRMARAYGDLSVDANLRNALHDALHPPVDVLAGCGFDDDIVFERARRGERSMRGLLKAIMDDFAARNAKARWSEKSPLQSAADVHSLFPEAQVIHIVRDPRDAIASALKMPWTSESAFALAEQWRRFTISNTRHSIKAGPDSALQIRYEDLTRDPEAVLRVLFAFIEEEFDPSILSTSERSGAAIMKQVSQWQDRAREDIAPAAEGGWRSTLPRGDRAIVQSVVHRELPVLGYQPASRRAVVVGRALAMPPRVAKRVERWRNRRRVQDPEHFEQAMRDYLAQQARAVTPGAP